MHLIISTSLNPRSRSALLAEQLTSAFEARRVGYTLIDLRELPLPTCDGGSCYQDANVRHLTELIKDAETVTIVSPVYNYDLASARNVLAVAGSALTGRIIGLMAAGGGRLAYTAPMGVANSLMLDFRCLIVPRFVYAAADDFDEEDRISTDVAARIDELADELQRLAVCLRPQRVRALEA